MIHQTIAILLSLTLLTQCHKSSSSSPNSNPLFDLTLTLNDFGTHANQQAIIGLYDQEEKKMVTQSSGQPDADGKIEKIFVASLTANHRYLVGYYVDMDGDGVCDEPPTDHGWVVKVSNVSGPTTKTDKHRMSFSSPCLLFMSSTEPTTTVTISGQLVIDKGIVEIDGVTPGAVVANATVFAAGFPEQEAQTDAEGNFVMTLNLGSALTAPESIDLMAWYTKSKPGFDPTDWAGADLRLGTLQAVALNQDKIKLETLSLTWTSAVDVLVQDENSQAIDGCWVNIPTLSFQLVSEAKKNGHYLLDYLPAGHYTIKAQCGSQQGTVDIDVLAASGRDAQQTVTITVQ